MRKVENLANLLSLSEANSKITHYPNPTGPETRAALVALDSVVDTETIDNFGDVDEFRISLNEGQRLEAFATTDSAALRTGFTVELTDPGRRGGILTLIRPEGTWNPTLETPANSSGVVTMTRSAEYHVTIRAASLSRGGYSFVIRAR